MKNHTIKDFENCTTAVYITTRNCRAYTATTKPITERAIPVEITKIGKKYVTIKNGTQFRVPTSGAAPYLEEHSQYSPDQLLFLSLEEAVEFEDTHRISDEIRTLTKKLPDGWKYFENYPPIDTLRQIKSLLETATSANK